MSPPPRRAGWAPGSAAQPALRIGDAERAGAVEALGEHFATGRLTHEEYDERATLALQARTAADVAPLFGDLPAPYPAVLTGRPASTATPAAPRVPHRLPVLPLLLVLLGLALLLQEVAVLLFGLAGLWWFSSVRRRRAREQGVPGAYGWPGRARGPHGPFVSS